MRACVIVARGLQQAYLGCYGNQWIATPSLDRLAAHGVVFDQHIADRAGIEDMLAAWQTGRYCFSSPDQTARSHLGDKCLSAEPVTDSCPSLFPLLRQQGVRTEAVRQQNFGSLEKTFDVVLDRLRYLAAAENWLLEVQVNTPLPADAVPEEFKDLYASEPPREEEESDQIEEEADRFEKEEDPAFLEWQQHYAAAVSYLDSLLGRVVAGWQNQYPDGLLLLTSDAGASSAPARDSGWREQVTHLPLLALLPHAAEAGRRVAALTQPVDFISTLCDWYAVQALQSHGCSLLPLIWGKAKQIRSYACGELRVNDGAEWILRTPNWTLAVPVCGSESRQLEKPALYVKPDDRWDVNDVRQHYLELSERLEGVLRGFVEATRQPGPLCAPEFPEVEVSTSTAVV